MARRARSVISDVGAGDPACARQAEVALLTPNACGPNAACAVGLIDRLTHHAEIISIDGESYRKREAEQAQKRKPKQKSNR
jgi:hypothetical protein